MTRFVRMSLLAGAFAIVSLAGQARADYLVTLTATVGPSIASSTGPSYTVVGATGSSVTLTPYNGTTGDTGDARLGTAASPIHLTFGSTSTTKPTGTDPYNFGYGFTLTFTHGASTVTSTVGGTIAGSLSPSGSTINNTYNAGTLTASYTPIDLGGQILFMKLDEYTPPGTPPNVKNDFSVSLYAAVPEPGTIALLGVGGLVMLAPSLRRRVRRIAETA